MIYLPVRQDPEGIHYHSAGPGEAVVENPPCIAEAVMRIGTHHPRPKPKGIISHKAL